MLKNYELLYVLHPDLEGTSDKVTEKITKLIEKYEGEVTGQEDWGKRKLAYKIAKNEFGVYILVNFTLPSLKLSEIERELRLSEEVLRYMIVVQPEVREAKPTRKAKKAEKAAEEKAVEKAEVKAEKKAEAVVADEVKEEKPKKTAAKPAAKKAPKAAEEKAEKKTTKKEEAERMKKLDEKLEEILGE